MHRTIPLAFLLLAATVPLAAQRPTVTAADYARAEKFLAANLTGLVVGGTVTPNWLPDDPSAGAGSPRAASTGDRFWYRNQTTGGMGHLFTDPLQHAAGRRPDRGQDQ